MKMRIDKFISQAGFGSRKDAKAILKSGAVAINGEIITRPEHKIDEGAIVYVGNEKIEQTTEIYIMLNKPAGVISASFDEELPTVIDILPESYHWHGLFSVSALQENTTGLLILTNDNIFAHRANSPKKSVSKVYHVYTSAKIEQKEILSFERGLLLPNGKKLAPAKLEPTDFGCRLTISGGFCNIERMFAAASIDISGVCSVSFAGIGLDPELAPGGFRHLNEEEMGKISNLTNG